MNTLSTAIITAYVCVTFINMIGLALVFVPDESRKTEIAGYRENGQFKGYSDWQVIALLILLAFWPYFNLGLFSSCLSVTCDKLEEWMEPFGKKKP